MNRSPFSKFNRSEAVERAQRPSTLKFESLEDRQMLSATDLAPLADSAAAPIVETASARVETPAIELAGVVDQEVAYNEHDLAVVESLGMTASDVKWDAQGRVTEIVCANETLLEADVSDCVALKTFTMKGDYNSYLALEKLDVSGCTALRELTCNYTNLTTLDVSNCSSLKTLNCFQTSLEALDVTTCPNLESLKCYITHISELDVSNCPNLKTLYCHQTQISSIDVSACSKLETLHVDNTDLTSLDVSGLTKLKSLLCNDTNIETLNLEGCASLDFLNCENAKLTSLDVAGLPVSTVKCGNNALTSLNIGGDELSVLACDKNVELSELDLSACPNLTKLTCWTTNLSALDVSGCMKLQHLECGATNIETLDFAGHTALNYLSAGKTKLSSLDISGCSNLGTLILWGTELTSVDASDCSKLYTLHFSTSMDSVKLNSEATPIVIAYDVPSHTTAVDANGAAVAAKSVYPSFRIDLTSNTAYPVTITYAKISGEVMGNAVISVKTALPAPAVTCSTTKNAVVLNIAAVENAEQYVVEYSTDPNFESFAAKTFASAGVKTIAELDPETTYYCRIRAVGTGYYDSESVVLSATTKVEALAAPVISVSADGATDAILSIAPATDAAYYAYDYSTDPDFSDFVSVTRCSAGDKIVSGLDPHATYYFRVCSCANGYDDSPYAYAAAETTLASPTVTASTTRSAIVLKIDAVEGADKYVVEYSTDADFATSKTKTFTAGVKTLSGLPYGTEYYVRVTATGAEYAASKPTELSATTKPEFLSAPEIAVEPSTPFAVNLTIGEAAAATGYRVEYSTNADFSDSTTLTYKTPGVKSISGLDCNTQYYFRVCAAAANYDASPYAEAATTTPAAAKLDAPIAKTSVTKTAIVLNISKVDGAEKFAVDYSTDPDFASYKTKNFTAGVRTLSGLTSGTTYYVRVRATSSTCLSSDDVEITATTKPAPVSSEDALDVFADYLPEDDLGLFWDTLDASKR